MEAGHRSHQEPARYVVLGSGVSEHIRGPSTRRDLDFSWAPWGRLKPDWASWLLHSRWSLRSAGCCARDANARRRVERRRSTHRLRLRRPVNRDDTSAELL